MKFLVVVAFIGILASLGSALFFMMRGDHANPARRSRMARALAVRVGLSVLLFLFILVAWQLGWIQPTGIRPGQ